MSLHPSELTAEVEAARGRLGEEFPSEAEYLKHVYLSPNTRVEKGLLTGFVAVVDGLTPATSGTCFTPALGSGSSWVLVHSDSAAADWRTISSKLRAVKAKLPDTVQVSYCRADAFPDPTFMLVATGNDATAARAFLSVAATGTVLEAMRTGGEAHGLYTAALAQSAAKRATALKDALRALGLKAEGEIGSQTSHSIVPPKTATNSSGIYLVYNNVVDPSVSMAGVLMSRGPVGGFLQVTGIKAIVAGKQSYAWVNSDSARLFSMMPADTGHHSVAARTADKHYKDAALTGFVDDHFFWTDSQNAYNQALVPTYNGHVDEHIQVALHELAPRATTKALHALCVKLPNTTTAEASLSELKHIIAQAPAASTVVVRNDNAVVVSLVQQWARVAPIMGYTQLSAALRPAKEGHVELDAKAITELQG